jgi:RNA polymerase sigma-70 factor (ECF subfamily)
MSALKSSRLRLVPRVVGEPGPSSHELRGGAPQAGDAALLDGVQRGDAALARAFCLRVRPIVDRTLTRLLGPADSEYEDVCQIALFELVETIHRFRRDCPLEAWASIVTARVAYRHVRRRRLERRIFGQLSLDIGEQGLVVLPAAVEARQAIERVKALLVEMDPKRVWTWLLHDVYGYDLREITEIMAVSLSAAQSRLVRGRRDVHERVAAEPRLAQYLLDFERGQT